MSSAPPFQGTREEWCERVLAVLERELAALGIEMIGDRQVRVAVAPLGSRALGRCHPSRDSADRRTNFITVSTAPADARDLVHVLLHELLHAFDDCRSGHRFRWRRWAQTLGMPTKHGECGPVATAMIDQALEEVGEPVAHVSSVHRSTAAQLSSQVKLTCIGCGVYVHAPRGLFESGSIELECVNCRLRLGPVCNEPI